MFECDCDCDKVEGFLRGVHKAGCQSLNAIYDEIHVGREENRLPTLPKKCPACGAPEVARSGKGSPTYSVTYACGGGYSPKPQIQNHTNKWWGRCKIDETAAVAK